MNHSKIIFVFLSIILFSGLFTSTNQVFADVDTWTVGDTGDAAGSTILLAVSMTSANDGVAVGRGGVIVHTSDGGVTWTVGDTGDAAGTTILNAVSMTSANDGVAVGNDGLIVHTSDGGVTWTVGDTGAVVSTILNAVSMTSANDGVSVGNDGVIIHTSDGGVTWTVGDTGDAAGTTILRGISMTSANDGVSVGNDGVIVHTSDGGVTWTVGDTGDAAGTTILRAVSMISVRDGVAVGDGGVIVHTSDGGVIWTVGDVRDAAGTTALRGISMTSANDGVAVGVDGVIVHTSDGGVNWIVVDVTSDAAGTTALLAVSMTSANDGVSVGAAGLIVYTVSSSIISSGGGGSASKYNTKPTFGIDPKTYFQIIEGGFSFNDVPIDITDNHWTQYEKQSIKVGESNEFETKVFASQKLKVQEFLFGIPVVGESHKAELGVEVFYDSSGEIEEIRVIQKTDIIDVDSIQIEKIKSKCRLDDSDEKCVTTQLQMIFLEPLKDSVMAIKAIDFKGRSQVTYLNDGFDISGNSLNPMKTMMIIGTEKYESLVKVTQIAKYSDVWMAQDGRAFEINEYGSSKLINQTIQDRQDTSNNLDRYNSEFTKIKKTQIDKAIKLLLEKCPECLDSFVNFADSWSYDYPLKVDRTEKITKLVEIEKQKATKVLENVQLLITYPDAEIDRDDRSISVILAEERAMKKILAEERAYLKQTLAPKQ